MPTIHCHLCGGFIADPAGTTYRSPDPAAPRAAIPHTALCTCEHAVVYEAATDPVSSSRPVHHIRSASRN
jgi:hypothetical protein